MPPAGTQYLRALLMLVIYGALVAMATVAFPLAQPIARVLGKTSITGSQQELFRRRECCQA